LRSRTTTTGGKVVEPFGDGIELVGHAKKEWTMNAEDADILRDVLVLQYVCAAFRDVLFCHSLTVVVSDTRRMKSSAARIMPISTASVRSARR